MTIDESRFSALAGEAIEHIADVVDDLLGDRIDVDVHGGILTLDLEGGGQYVINKHAPNRQIWLSSPVSGAWHFDYADGQWVSSRAPKVVLTALLQAEMKEKFGVSPEF